MAEIKIQKLVGVMGWPIHHSLSPQLHGFWLSKYGINGAYVPLAVSLKNIEAALRSLPKLGFAGTNLTAPLKEEAMRIVDHLDPVAERIGAINTVFVNEDGYLSGTNTDSIGFMENLKNGAPEWEPSKSSVVVLGAGGAARAVVAALVDVGVPEIRLINRTLSRAHEVSLSVGGPVSVYGWSEANECLSGAGLVVNTTTLGMQGQPPMQINLGGLPSDTVVTDIVYTPLMTPFLNQANTLGLKCVDGLGMLLHQAALGFEGWFGQKPEVTDELRTYVLTKIAERSG